MTFWKWSRTASSNATADSTCPFPEGMAPSAVNDGVRGLMAAAAKYRDDLAGAIATAGTSTAYTVFSYQGFDTLAHLGGLAIAFTPHTGNGATVTLNVDGLGARPLRSAPGVELPAAVLVQGTPYVATYNATDGAFYLQGFYNLSSVVPVGAFMPFSSLTPPNSNFILPYGQALSRANYSAYFGMVGTIFGAGDGTTTFNAPDTRGRVIIGQDNMGGIAAGRVTLTGGGVDGVVLGAAGGAQNKVFSIAEMPAHVHTNTLNDPGHSHSTNGLSGIASGGTTSFGNNNNINVAGIIVNGSSTGITLNNGSAGSGSSFSMLQPSITLPILLRVI